MFGSPLALSVEPLSPSSEPVWFDVQTVCVCLCLSSLALCYVSTNVLLRLPLVVSKGVSRDSQYLWSLLHSVEILLKSVRLCCLSFSLYVWCVSGWFHQPNCLSQALLCWSGPVHVGVGVTQLLVVVSPLYLSILRCWGVSWRHGLLNQAGISQLALSTGVRKQ